MLNEIPALLAGILLGCVFTNVFEISILFNLLILLAGVPALYIVLVVLVSIATDIILENNEDLKNEFENYANAVKETENEFHDEPKIKSENKKEKESQTQSKYLTIDGLPNIRIQNDLLGLEFIEIKQKFKVEFGAFLVLKQVEIPLTNGLFITANKGDTVIGIPKPCGKKVLLAVLIGKNNTGNHYYQIHEVTRLQMDSMVELSILKLL